MVYATDGQKAAAGQLPGNVNLDKRPEPQICNLLWAKSQRPEP